MFMRDGYSQTTVAAIAAASGVSTTTFFRYFDTKAEIVWAEFDAHISRLRKRFESDATDAPVLVVVRGTVLRTLGEDLDSAGLSLLRFELFDGSAELRSDESEHWAVWAEVVSAYVARRSGRHARAVLPSAIGGAVQATMLAVLRGWSARPVDREAILAELDRELVVICNALTPLLRESQ
jgi:AcrR family transcriptional regulator